MRSIMLSAVRLCEIHTQRRWFVPRNIAVRLHTTANYTVKKPNTESSDGDMVSFLASAGQFSMVLTDGNRTVEEQ